MDAVIKQSRPAAAILAGVDRAVESRWEPAKRRAAMTVGDSVDDRVDAVIRSFAREMGIAGALTGGVAAVPGVGTAAAIAAGIADVGTFAFRSADLILTIAALHGYDDASVEERRAWVLAILAFGDGAAATFVGLAGEVGKGLGKKMTARIPSSALARVNASLGRTIVTKYGTKRGVIAIGRALPFGIGAVIGGGKNYAGTRTIGRQARGFFDALAPDESPVQASTAQPAPDR